MISLIKSLIQKEETEERLVTLIPLAMTIPNREGVYSLSFWRSPKTITESEWRTYNSIEIKMGTPDNWQWVTAYCKGLSCYYIVE